MSQCPIKQVIIFYTLRNYLLDLYRGQNSGSRLGDGAIVTQLFVIGAGFFG